MADTTSAELRLRDDEEHVLDTLVWQSLTSTHARFADGGDLARRFEPDVTVFAATADDSPAAWSALADVAGAGAVVLLCGPAIELPEGWTHEGGGTGHQMILDDPAVGSTDDGRIVALTAADVPQMLDLVGLTQPGPFCPRTIELGDYFGVFVDGQLVAMAGERLQTPGFTEISAVCTHPSVRGQGLAAALTRRVAGGIVGRGQRPILHVAEHNHDARRVYERLGFVARCQLQFVAARTPA